jgi:hypothetical protein
LLKNFSGMNAIARLTNAAIRRVRKRMTSHMGRASLRRDVNCLLLDASESSGSYALFHPIRSDVKREPYANIAAPYWVRMSLLGTR